MQPTLLPLLTLNESSCDCMKLFCYCQARRTVSGTPIVLNPELHNRILRAPMHAKLYASCACCCLALAEAAEQVALTELGCASVDQ